MKTRQQWLEMIGTPQNYAFPKTRTRVKKYDHPDFEHASLLAAAAPKPFCLLAGQHDTEESRQMILNCTPFVRRV